MLFIYLYKYYKHVASGIITSDGMRIYVYSLNTDHFLETEFSIYFPFWNAEIDFPVSKRYIIKVSFIRVKVIS